MFFKSNNILLKYLDFIMLDLFCLICAFFNAYYLKFNNYLALDTQEWSALFIMICFMNLIVMFCINPYKGIYKRRYYLQLKKELTLFIYQVTGVCVIFYAFKIGMIFSREMLFTMYSLYFVLSQIVKYFYKKIRNKEISFNEIKIKFFCVKDGYNLACIKDKTKNYMFFYQFTKRCIDIVFAVMGCLLLIPLTIIVFILNKLNGEEGPIFYIQERIGKNGKIFKMYKYRSMCINADEKLELFLEENEDIRKEFYIYRKIKNDPRITKVGKFLRKTSLDEFPQFINLLIGNMSLVRA